MTGNLPNRVAKLEQDNLPKQKPFVKYELHALPDDQAEAAKLGEELRAAGIAPIWLCGPGAQQQVEDDNR